MALLIRKHKKKINECDGGAVAGGVGAPFSTLGNTGGVGNVVMPGMAATTAAEQAGTGCMGSGDVPMGAGGMNFQAGVRKPKKRKILKIRKHK